VALKRVTILRHQSFHLFHAVATMTLDSTDLALLDLLQHDNRRALRDYAADLGISPPTCLRRLRRLEKGRVITRHSAILDPLRAGFGVLAYVEVVLADPSGPRMAAFERRMQRCDEVLVCAELAGHIDYLLTVAARDLPAFRDFTRRYLGADAEVRRFRSMLVLRHAKSGAGLPLAR
jgi:Lrp/AsnC family transcriptional regulator, leucine-responsive regulatory protein